MGEATVSRALAMPVLAPGDSKATHTPREHLLCAPWTQGEGSEKWPHVPDHPFTQQAFHQRQAYAEGMRRPEDPSACPHPLSGRCRQRPQTLNGAFCEDEHFSGVQKPLLSFVPQNHLGPGWCGSVD